MILSTNIFKVPELLVWNCSSLFLLISFCNACWFIENNEKRWEKICCILLFWHLLKIVTSVTVGFSFFLFFKLKKNSLLLNQGRLDKCTVQGYSLKKKIITATKRFYNQSVNSPTPNPIRNDWDKKNWSDMHLHVCRALVV